MFSNLDDPRTPGQSTTDQQRKRTWSPPTPAATDVHPFGDARRHLQLASRKPLHLGSPSWKRAPPETVFNDLGEIVSFKSSGIAATKLQERYPAMKKVGKPVLYVCFDLLPEEPEERLLLQDFLGRRDLHRQLREH